MPLFETTDVASRRDSSKKTRLFKLLESRNPGLIDDAVLTEFKAALTPISESYLRQLLKASGRPLSPLVEGVVTHDFADLERTLAALERAYVEGDRKAQAQARALVMEAKNRIRWAIKRHPSIEKDEMLLWVLTWLENPGLFTLWVQLRRAGGGTHPAPDNLHEVD